MKKQEKSKNRVKTKPSPPPSQRRAATKAARPADAARTRPAASKADQDGKVPAGSKLARGASVQLSPRKTAMTPTASRPAVGERRKRAGSVTPPPTTATSQDPIQFEEEAPPKIETFLTPDQLQEFKELLLQKRAELAGDVQRLTAEARKENGFNEQSTMPIHMADLGSDNWEQDFTLGLIVNEQNLVREIDEALARIEDRTYGICLATQKRITVGRLRAKPWAKHCIEYERAREEGRAP